MVTFYTTHCPKCKVLETKLKQKKIEYKTIEDIDYMVALGLKNAPALQIDGEDMMDFATAIKWVNAQEAQE